MIRDHRLKALAATILCMSMATSMLVMIPGTTHAAPADGWIEGTITDGVNPIPNVMLIYVLNMMGGGNPLGSGWTDALGHYNLTVTGGLDYMVLAFEGSYYSSTAMASVVSGETAVADFVMTPIDPAVADVTLRGFVKDEMGNPVTVGSIIGFTNDPVLTEGGAPYYGNGTVPDAFGEYSVNVLAGALGGGVGIMEVPGYGFAENSSSDPFVSGMTYWFNITLSLSASTDDAVLRGSVTDSDTGLTLENVLVSIESRNAWNENRSYTNYTFTDSSGIYEMNVTNGTSDISFSKSGYSMYRIDGVQIDPSDVLTIDVQLKQANATVMGNVTDSSDDSPIANARVYLTDMVGNFTMTYTNSSGAYVLQAFAGTDLALVAEADGYAREIVMGDILPGDTLWVNFRLQPVDAWLTGRVTDAISGAPIQYASLSVQAPGYSDWTDTNAMGDYNFTGLVSGNYTININAMNYRSISDSIEVLPGGNVYDAQMMPWDIPDSCMLWGYVIDSTSMAGISGASIEIGTGAPDYGERNSTSTNGTGYYEMWIPPIQLTYVATASDHVHDEGVINASGLTDLRLDIALDLDLWSPNITYNQAPLENVSWTNPSLCSISIEEIDPSMFALSQFLYFNSELGMDNYYLVAMYYDGFNPLDNPSMSLPYASSGDNYTIDFLWDASANGGWLSNSTSQQYFGSYELWMGPQQYEAIRGFYTNSTLGSWFMGTAWFDASTDDFVFFQFEGSTPYAYASDPTGIISPAVHELQVDPIGPSTNWIQDVMMGEWSVVDLKFQHDEIVPSGRWVNVFSVSDFGNHGNGAIEFLTVDNEPPVANAGSDQQAVENTPVTLDGSGSSDNVGLVDYAWSFWDDGTYYDIHGAVVVFNFTQVSDHNITLTVTDGAGHVSSALVWVNVTADQAPVADAGPDQIVLVGTVVFDGSGSSDDVGIVNWTWTFVYDGNPQTLWGENPTFDFLIEALYVVTLVVNDTAGQTSTDTVQINVASVIPEFPMMLIPISGMLLLIVAIGAVRRRRQ